MDSRLKGIIEKIGEAAEILPDLDEDDFLYAIDAITALFYIDPYDRPDLKPG